MNTQDHAGGSATQGYPWDLDVGDSGSKSASIIPIPLALCTNLDMSSGRDLTLGFY